MYRPGRIFPRKTQPSSAPFRILHITLLLLALFFLFPNLTPEAHASHVVHTRHTIHAVHATAAAYTVSGTVFDDYNQNGTQDNSSTLVEPGLNGIIVTAYNAAGAAVTSATTSTVSSVLGQYSLSIPAGTGPTRIQFSNFGPTSTIADLTGLQQSNHVGGTSVQFISGASSTNIVNLGLERPSEYCQNQPTLATSCYVIGDQTTASQPVLYSFSSSASGTTPSPTTLANSTDIGSTWGLAYRRSSDSLFASAYMKRHAGFKPSGSTGAIYLISGASSASPGTPSLFVDLNTAVAAGTAGPNPHDTTNYTQDNSSGDAYDNVGKVSLGGMALSDDQTTLYVMNLYDQKLYSIAVGTPPATPAVGTISSTAVPVPSSCTTSGDFRPFAVTAYHGLIYVGAVCSAESTVTGSVPLGDPTKLMAYVFVYTPGSGFTSSPVFQSALNYSRRCTNDAYYSDCTSSGSANINVGNPAAWNPWHPGFIGYRDLGHSSSQQYTDYAQPMLSTIAFDNGNLFLGLRDRFGDQAGHNLLTPDGTRTISGITAGDALRACLTTPGTFSSGWTLESNGTCGGITTAGASNSRLGPGGGQYYYQNYYQFGSNVYHDNTATGSIVQLPGSTTMTTTVLNPGGVGNTGGVSYANNTTGAQTASYQVYGSSATNFSRSNGLGGLTALCQSAPVEIGNRVWDDTNGDGIQDAGEPGIPGVTVHLYSADGSTLLQTTTTNSAGEYYFTISPYTSYLIKLDKASDYATGGALQSYQLTTANQDTTNRITDSKATLLNSGNAIGTGNYPTISIAAHTPGQNDDSFDVGFVPSAASYSVSGTIFNDYNEDGVQSTTEPGINGVIVTAYNAAGVAVDTATTSTLSSALGQYSLVIPAGTGPVRIQFSNFGSSSTIADLTGLQPSNHTGGTSVQFVSGASSTNTINLGLERPEEYCQNNPDVATSCYIIGDQTVSNPAIVRFPYNSRGTSPTPTQVATTPNVGSTWGLAYRRSTDSLFTTAFMKRHSGFKPSGSTGAIYLISGADSATPTTGSTPFLDLNVLFGANTAGANPHDTTNYPVDTAGYDGVGKVSLGGLAVSGDESTLYTMNLADKMLYSIPIGAPPAAPTAPTSSAITRTAMPLPSDCVAGDFRPFAVTYYREHVYVGAVCSAESTVTGSLPLGDPAAMHAYVFVYTPGSGFTTTPVFEFALNYTRHCVFNTTLNGCNAVGVSRMASSFPAAWNPWHPTFIGYQQHSKDAIVYPQPMLTGIAFNNGDLILGLRDRFGDQTGVDLYDTPSSPSNSNIGMSAGDTLRACLNTAGTATSGWMLESNGTCGSIQTSGHDNGKGPGTGTFETSPGNGQYYYQDYFSPYHDHVSEGGVLQIPEQNGVMVITYDPLSGGTTYTGGVRTYDNTLGNGLTSGYQIFTTSPGGNGSTYGKANGLGSLAAFCQSAPIEIGNRVWADTNNNGIQDPGESGIAGATVHLYAANGTTLLQTTTTDSAGEYYFTVPAYVGYVIKLDTAADYATGGVLHLFRLTTANQDTINHIADSNATLPTPASPIGTGNYPTISIASHTPGQNDDSFDVGFVPPNDLSQTKTVQLSGGNLALAATPSASSTLVSTGWSLNYVNDGILTSTASSMGWSSNATLTANHTEWVQLNLGASHPIQVVNLYPRNDGANTGYGFPIDFTIATSSDGVTWNPLITRTGSALPSGVQSFTFPTQTVRYVRITGTNLRSNPNDSNNYRMQFAEISVY